MSLPTLPASTADPSCVNDVIHCAGIRLQSNDFLSLLLTHESPILSLSKAHCVCFFLCSLVSQRSGEFSTIVSSVFVLRFDSVSTIREEHSFADVDNLEHCVKYLNQSLVTYGFSASLDLFATDPVRLFSLILSFVL